MVTTRTKPTPPPAPKLSKAAKAAKAKAAKEAKQAEKAAKDAEKAAKAEAKAAKIAARAAAKAAKDEAKAAKPAKVPKTIKKPAKRAKASESGSDSGDDREPSPKRHKTTFHEARSFPIFTDVPPPPISKPQVEIGEWDYSKQLPVPKRIVEGVKFDLPKIYVGGSAPWPRWVVTRDETIPKPGLPQAAINLYTGVQWRLDEGHFTYWGGLDYRALFELAWACLECMMADSALRSEIYASLAEGPLSKAVASGKRWHPTLPSQPVTRHFGPGNIEKLKLRSNNNMAYYYDAYERPPVAVRPAGGVQRGFEHVISNKLYNLPRRKWPTAPRSPSPELEGQSDSDRGDSEDSEESSEEESDSDSPRRPSLAVEQLSGIVLSQRQKEPAGPLPLGNDEAFAQAKKSSVIDSSVGDDSGDISQLEDNAAHDFREQSPDDLRSSFGSGSEVSELPRSSKAEAADSDSA
ncbi:uncharacterized protein N7515_006662 [Penicillium bovifimosum]|uniref:Uncharacterized protein n=1 Tax=Penicillium bovifimosum TaxID=126998 RepID=A0A9W9KZY8_9EURO|nr:uncharacterized protein N7515_006662 [Penicillium bovifimosum]KAJ5130623.1 hypothetical protein N7515_006662 [Penicillium bovifimosum]